MAKSAEKYKAVALRKQGKSIKDIAYALQVSKSSASIWCRDISLTPLQIDRLHSKMVGGNYLGSMRGALANKKKREAKIKQCIMDGKKAMGVLSQRDFLMVGLGLHLGEGGKGRSFQFTNANPAIIKLMIAFLQRSFNIPHH